MFERRLSLNVAIDAFILDCEIRNLKPSTIRNYKNKLKILANYTTELSSQILKEFQLYLLQLNKSDRYIFNICVAVNTFLKFCYIEGITPELLRVKLPKVQDKVKKAFTEFEIKAILKVCTKERDYLICCLLLETGVRSNELVSIELKDIELSQGLIKIRNGKYGERFVVIGSKLRKALFLYIADRKKGFLFRSSRGNRLTLSGLIQMMKRLKKKTGIQHLHAHTFRRTFAINSVRQGVNIHILAKLMGHKDIETLKQYLDITLDDMKKLSYSMIDNL